MILRACIYCTEHPGWAHPESTGKRRDPQDVCRKCLGSGVHQPQHVAEYPEGCLWERPSDHAPRHSTEETIMVCVEERTGGYCSGFVVRGSGDRAESTDFEVDDCEPDDVWGPISGRILEQIGIDLGPDNYDSGPVKGADFFGVEQVLEIDVDHRVAS